jgi:hypothetical protein
MAFYVNVPKDLSKVKNKVAFNLTKRQLICFGIAAAIGFPVYFLTRGLIGNSNAATIMVMLMVPAFVFAMYERDGQPLEKVLGNFIRVRYLKPQIRRYETTNTTRARPVSRTMPPEKGGTANGRSRQG